MERVHHILSCHDRRVCGRRGWHVVVVGKKIDCVRNLFFACISYVIAMATIMFGGQRQDTIRPHHVPPKFCVDWGSHAQEFWCRVVQSAFCCNQKRS